MVDRLYALLPKFAALTLVWVLTASGITFAAGGREPVPPAAPKTAAAKGPKFLVVPDVRRQAYVFAKGILEDGGFAWRVEGDVEGYAANVVVTQKPVPGTKVMGNGAPTIVLRLERNTDYAERGLPENRSPHDGTALVLASKAAKHKQSPRAKKAVPQKPSASRKAKSKQSNRREPAFQAPGAPREPLDELPLPDRARLLEKRLAGQPKLSPSLVKYWLYQHAWIVTGAKFGWSDGAEAVRILIRVDRSLQARWGVGAKSEAVARAALAEVERKSRR